MTDLPDALKREIVKSLASFDTHWDVADWLEAEHSVPLSRQQIDSFDPTKRAGRGLDGELRNLFHGTRRAHLAQNATVSIAHRALRLQMLNELARLAMITGNLRQARECLVAGAKEVADSEPKQTKDTPDRAAIAARRQEILDDLQDAMDKRAERDAETLRQACE